MIPPMDGSFSTRIDLVPGVGELERGLDPRDAAADHQRRAW